MKRSVVYKALRDHAKGNMAYLRFVDLQMNQMQNATQNYPVPLPALFFEIGDVRFSNLLEHNQKGDVTISLYLYLDLVSDSFSGAERENQTIDLLDYMDEVFQVFEGFAITGITPLARTVEYRPQYGKRFIMFRVDFSTTMDSRKEITRQTADKPEPDMIPQFKF